MDPHRTTTPERTRVRVEPALRRFGITRVAELTGLDDVGLPVHAAYRPCGATLAVSIGIGLEPDASWVGAVMESIEIWHGENPVLDTVATAPAADLDLPYGVDDLTLAPRSPLTADTVLDWVPAVGLLSGRPVPVPAGLVRLDSVRRMSWDGVLFDTTSNGMATGNTAAEAVLHGLLEVIERDSCRPFLTLPLSERRWVDPDGTDAAEPGAVVAALRGAGCRVELWETTGPLGVPCYAAAVWSPELPVHFTGFGCHPDAARAAYRAMAEATLSRLAGVSGARDDLDEAFYRNADPTAEPPEVPRELRPVGGTVGPEGGIDAAIRFCAEQVRRVTGIEPLVVDLTRADVGIPTVKVVAPGLRMLDHRAMAAARPGDSDG